MNTVRSKRLRMARQCVKHHQASAVLLTDALQLQWLLGVPCESDQLLMKPRTAYWYADTRGRAPLFAEGRVRSFQLCREDLRAVSGIILVDADTITVSQLKRLRMLVRGSGSRIKPVSGLLRDLRMVKSVEEQKDHARAAAIADEALALARTHVKLGMSEQGIAQLIERTMVDAGADKPAFDTIVAFGENSAVPHHRPSRTRKLRNTDPVLIDMGAVYNGAHSDMSRTYAPVSWKSAAYQDAFERVWDAVYESQQLAIEAVKDGAKATDIAVICRESLKDSGFPDGFPHATGHGVGLEIHEAPIVSIRSKDVLKSGMIVTVEPGLYGAFGSGRSKNTFGVRIEDAVCVTTDKANVYTQSPIAPEPFVVS